MGKVKGNSYERKIAKQLSLWWTEGKSDDIFWRSSNSGGRATVRAKRNSDPNKHCGDISAIDPVGEALLKVFVIEVKCGYSKHTIHDLIDKTFTSKKQVYEEWIETAERDRKNAGALYWMIIHKRNRREPIILIPYGFFEEGGYEIMYDVKIHLELKNENSSFIAIPLNLFMPLVSPIDIKNLALGRNLIKNE